VDLVALTLEQVPLDGSDLPGYAGRLFDHYAEHEDVVRLDFEADELLDLVVLLSLSATPLVARLNAPREHEPLRRTVVAAARAIASGSPVG
jgi:hypothetical protein